MAQFGFIGMGNMGYAMLNGVLGEFAPGQIIFTTPHKEKCEKISAQTGVKYAESNQIDRKVEVTLLKTREDIREELGMNVKMINRAVVKLKEEGLIDTRKGKVVLSKKQYHRAKEEIGKYVS